MVVGTVRDIMMAVRAPRAVFVNHPVGQTFGRPRARRIQRQILTEALNCAHLFKTRGQIIDLSHEWKDGSGMPWEERVEKAILHFKG